MDTTHFDTLGFERKYRLDRAALEDRYRDLSKAVHPDRFAKATPAERLMAVQKATDLNDAYRVLKDDVKRAEYLLLLEGIDVSDENKPSERKATRPMIASAPLLMEVMELREGLEEARAAKDEARIEKLRGDVDGKRKAALAQVEAGFAKLEAGDRNHLMEIAQSLVSMRYYARFLDEVEVHHDAKAGA